MFLTFRRILVFRSIMASNPYRFVPSHWLRAAEQTQSRGEMYDFTADTGYWPYQINSYNVGPDLSFWPYTNGNPYYHLTPGHTSYCNGTHARTYEGKGGHKGSRHSENDEHGSHARPEHKRLEKSPTLQQRKRTKFHPSRQQVGTRDPVSFLNDGASGRWCGQTTASRYIWNKQKESKLGGATNTQFTCRQKSNVPAGHEMSDFPVASAGIADRLVSPCRHKLERKWEDIDLPPGVHLGDARNNLQIRIMSYNILSQTLLNLNHALYRHCDVDVLPWEFRWSNIKMEIKELDADILCLQEIEECHFKDQISPFLVDAGYQCHYKRRTSNNPNKPDGVLTAFRKSAFEMVEEKKVEYYRGEVSLVNQHNVGVVTLLRPVFRGDVANSTDNTLCVVNTHLLYSPKRGDVKLVQLSTLFAEVHRIVSGYGRNIPIILCGDLNSTARSLLYEFITKQHIEFEGLEARYVSGQRTNSKGRMRYLPDPLLPECLSTSDECRLVAANEVQPGSDALREAYQLRHSLGPLQSVHLHRQQEASTTQDKGITVDYIFHTPPATVEQASVSTDSQNSVENDEKTKPGLILYPSRRLCLVTPKEMRVAGMIPNSAHSSDHLPIVADFLVTVTA